jgi:ADP-ribose pyrophosphatase
VRPQARELVYRGRQIDVHLERWGEREREVVSHPGSVAVVAVDAGERVVLVRQLREPARERLLELPAGTLEAGEEPLETARRELTEETGLRGGTWRPLAACWTSPGFLDERMHLFLARGVVEGERAPQGDEDVEVVRWPLADVERRLAEIEDAKTLAGLLLLLRTRPA